MVMQIYNPLSQQEQEEIDRRFAEPVDALEFVSENNREDHTRLSSAIEINGSFWNHKSIKKHYISIEANINFLSLFCDFL